jgi:hypothetical protein
MQYGIGKETTSVADPDLDLFGRIRIMVLKNSPISTFLVYVKATNTSGIAVA